MKKKKLTIGFVVLFFVVISTTILASATVYPKYNTEQDCRGCHGSDVSDRHHLLVANGTRQCTDCHPIQYDNVTQQYSPQVIRNCLICHPGKDHTDVHHILASKGLFVCSDCHPLTYDVVSQTYSPKITWDCTVCHSTVFSIQNVTPTPTPDTTPDPTPPVITVNGSNPVNITVGTTYIDAGAVAVDAVDGSVAVVPTGSVNTKKAGTYIITYTSTDKAGNKATAIRIVNVVKSLTDTIHPVITINGLNPVNITVGTTYIDAGAVAVDAVDGSVAVVTTGSVNTKKAGTYTITYTSTDKAGNKATAIRIVNVVKSLTDTIHPVITINGLNPVNITVGTTYIDAGAVAVDAVDGSVAVVATGSVNTKKAGTYTITYTSTDKAGNKATAIRIVNVVKSLTDTIHPVITINGLNPVNITVGTTYIDAGAVAVDAVDGSVAVVATGSVNTKKAGTYTITYTSTDKAGNKATAIRIVNVVKSLTDTIHPVITINGLNPVNITVGTTYIDAGAVAVDAVDGSVAVVATGSVNTK